MFATLLNYHWDISRVTGAAHIKHQQVLLKWKWFSVITFFCIFVFHESHPSFLVLASSTLESTYETMYLL